MPFYTTPHIGLQITIIIVASIGWWQVYSYIATCCMDCSFSSCMHVHELHQQDALLMSTWNPNFILLQLPNICHFQDLNYTIIIKRIQPSHDTITGDIVIGPKTVRGHTEVLEAVNNGLVANAAYLVLVDMDTVAGRVSSNTTFGKQSLVRNESTWLLMETVTV